MDMNAQRRQYRRVLCSRLPIDAIEANGLPAVFCWFDIWPPTQLGLKRWNSGGVASPGLPLPTGSSSARGVVLPAAVNQRKDQQKRHKIGTLIGTLMGKPSINGPFSMAMLNNQMVLSQWHRCHCFSLIVYSCYSCICRLKNTCIETVVHCVWSQQLFFDICMILF